MDILLSCLNRLVVYIVYDFLSLFFLAEIQSLIFLFSVKKRLTNY